MLDFLFFPKELLLVTLEDSTEVDGAQMPTQTEGPLLACKYGGFCPALSYTDYQTSPTKADGSCKVLRSLCSYPSARNPEHKSPLDIYYFQFL